MFTDEEGIHAIIALQKHAGITESREEAEAGWANMEEWEKEATEEAYNFIIRRFG